MYEDPGKYYSDYFGVGFRGVLEILAEAQFLRIDATQRIPPVKREI